MAFDACTNQQNVDATQSKDWRWNQIEVVQERIKKTVSGSHRWRPWHAAPAHGSQPWPETTASASKSLIPRQGASSVARVVADEGPQLLVLVQQGLWRVERALRPHVVQGHVTFVLVGRKHAIVWHLAAEVELVAAGRERVDHRRVFNILQLERNKQTTPNHFRVSFAKNKLFSSFFFRKPILIYWIFLLVDQKSVF